MSDQSASERDWSDLPRAQCSCGWTWTAIDALESGGKYASGVRDRLSSMAEGHAYFNREGGHVVDTIRKADVDDQLVEELREVVSSD